MNDHILDSAVCPVFECFHFDSSAARAPLRSKTLSHYFSEILLVRSGFCRIVRGTRTHELGPGEMIYIAPLVPHSI